MNVDDVAGLDERIAVALAGPQPIGLQDDQFVVAHASANLERRRAGDNRMHIVAGSAGHRPVGMPVLRNRQAGCENVLELALPAMTALIFRESIKNRMISGLLQVQIERSFDLEA